MSNKNSTLGVLVRCWAARRTPVEGCSSTRWMNTVLPKDFNVLMMVMENTVTLHALYGSICIYVFFRSFVLGFPPNVSPVCMKSKSNCPHLRFSFLTNLSPPPRRQRKTNLKCTVYFLAAEFQIPLSILWLTAHSEQGNKV